LLQRCVSNGGANKGKKGRMPNSKISALARRPLWIITCYRNNRMEVLTVDPDGDGGSLPVFSFKEEAKTFLGLSENDQEEGRRWRSRETTAGELVSVLMAPCAEVRQVALDPLPLTLGMGRLMASLCSVARERFVEELLRKRREPTGELVSA
jgi:hypothetical protein